MQVCTPEEMRNLDHLAIHDYQIPETILMENAGLAAFRVIMDRFHLQGLSVAILAGSGNNGGDGLVVARHVHAHGGIPYLLLLDDPGKFTGAAKVNLSIMQSLPVSMELITSLECLEDVLDDADLIVDAIFGTGLDRKVSGFFKKVICSANESGLPIISLDIPSGISGLSGQIMGEAIQADVTISFGLPKRGNLFYPGYERGGELFVTHIGFPYSLQRSDDIEVSVSMPVPLPPRQEAGYKSTFGDALFIAGAMGYFGAPVFSAMAHLRSGGGYARLAAPASIIPFLAARGGEIVYHPQMETDEATLSSTAKDELINLADHSDFVVIGPGLSLNDDTQSLVRELVHSIKKPMLIDGDGLAALCGGDEMIYQRQVSTVLTPHQGEMVRLSGKTKAAILADPVLIIQNEAVKRNAIIVLKGAHSLIGFPDERVFINLSGNSGMATAGSGDVLTGVISAMFGLGLPLEQAVLNAVFLHGFAGDLAADELGADGLTAGDILNYLPTAMQQYREHREDILQDYYHTIVTI
ncbi:NAD(P)H-hydrate dehydratase [bacterium]|nr:NAD(P)H-hydrate dehydratase [bacterium]